MINISVKLGKTISNLPAGILQGSYEDFSSMWYIDVGTQILIAMILEMGAPHAVPVMQYIWTNITRCHDRGCSFNKTRSKKLLQQEYEELYIGPEFQLDVRLAQIVAITWVTFMYSSGMPVLFILVALNFFMIFWVDKFLLLRFYKTPKNYDEQSIKFSISEMKWSFLFHFIVGTLVYSNDRILSSSGKADFVSFAIDPLTGTKNIQSIFNLERYNSVHVLFFVAGNVALMILMLFESTILSFLITNISCFTNI